MMQPWVALVRFGFRLLYNELAFTYDLVSWLVSLGAWRCWQRSALRYLVDTQNGLVLELAHGTGNLQVDLQAGGWRSIGHDLSTSMGRIASRKLRQAGLPVRLTRGYAQALPYPSGLFVSVVSTFPTDFILDGRTLAEVWRVLQPEGRLVIVPNGMLTSGNLVARGIEWLYRVTGQREPEHLMFDVSAFFAERGFTAEVHEVPCPRSVATVIVAKKALDYSAGE